MTKSSQIVKLRGTEKLDVFGKNPSQYLTQWKSKGLLPSKYNRAVIKKKSIENALRKAYN